MSGVAAAGRLLGVVKGHEALMKPNGALVGSIAVL